MIQLDQVSLSFSGRCLFEEVSFSLQKGERCGLVGRNGSGKSTLLKLIDGELSPDKGTISIPKDYRIGYLRQHISFTEPTILQEAAKAIADKEMGELHKAEKILFGLGFTEEDMDKSPNQFSGGFHLRLHLAKVLIAEPDCLLLDEPTNYLDILSIRWLQSFLSRWKGEFILISHDRDFMDKVTTHTIGIHRNKVRKIKGSTLDFFSQLLQEEEVYEKTRQKIEKKRVQVQKFVDRFGAKATKAAQAQSKKKLLEREPVLEKLNQLAELSFSFLQAPFSGAKLLEADAIEFSYGENSLISHFSLEILKGEKIAIIGKNGRGKSTLLRLIAGELKPKKGTFKYSENVKAGYFGQTNIDRLNSQSTIEEEIASSNSLLTYQEVKGIAGAMMFSGPLSEKKISVLSGGEKSRVLIGKIIAKPSNLLLLDEPTHHLDIESIEALVDALEDFSGACVIVTHSELILRRLNFDKIIICADGKQTLFQGNYDDFLEKLGWEEEKKATSQKKENPNIRKERADWVARRSAAIKPIERKIQACEEKIILLEEEQKKNQARLERGEASPDLIKKIGVQHKELQDLEAELYALYDLFESKKQEFEATDPLLQKKT